MTVSAVPASDFFAEFSSLASGFEGAALGDAEIAGVFGILGDSEPSDKVFLSAHTALDTLLLAYRQAVANADRSEMQRLGSLIALNIRENAALFNRLLAASSPRARDLGVTGKRFGSAEDALAALKPHATGEATATDVVVEEAAKTPATVAMVSAAQYLEGLRADEDGKPVNFSVLHHSVLEDLAGLAGLTFLTGGVLEFLLLKGLIKMSPPSITEVYELLGISALSFGYAGYKFLTLRTPRQYVRHHPPALYDRKTGEVMSPTLAKFRQGAVPLYPVDEEYDVAILPVGSHVLLKDVRAVPYKLEDMGVPSDSLFVIHFPGEFRGSDALFGFSEQQTAALIGPSEGRVTFVGVVTQARDKYKNKIPLVKVVRILPEPPK